MTGLRNLIGHTLGGRYRIDEILGKGGMSAVYKAYDPNLRRVVAVKVIHPHLADDPKFITRFQEEAAAVAMLRHPNIVQVYDFNHDGDELYYMVQEYIPGETLQERLRRLNAAGGNAAGACMPIPDAVRLTIQICNAAEYAHQRGMVHRDIKPANIMIDQSGQGILMDFGIVKIIGGAQHTSTGVVVGTALYMAPETIHGQPPDRRSDVYSLGVTLFEMINGRPPFESDSAMAVMMMHVNQPTPDLLRLRPDTPAELVAIIEKSLAKKSDERYESMFAFAADLKALARRIQAGVAGDAPAPNTLNLAVDTPPPSRAPAHPAPQPPPNGAATLVEPSMADEATRIDKTHLASTSSRPTPDSAGTLPEAIPHSEPRPSSSSPPDSRSTLVEPLSSASASHPTSVESPISTPRAVSTPNNTPRTQDTPTHPPASPKPSRRSPLLFVIPTFMVILVVIGAAALLFLLNRAASPPAADAAESTSATPAAPAAAAIASTTAPATITEAAAAPINPPLPASPTAAAASDTPVAAAALQTVAATPAASTAIIPPPGVPFALINGVSLDNRGRYNADYETFEFTEKLDDLHLVFFYNTQTTDQGYMYGGPRPFDKFTAAERPRTAMSLCIAVANRDHSIRQNSGACQLLPDVVAISASAETACLQGPGSEFPTAATLPAGTPALALGISPDESWWSVANPDDPDDVCWLPVAETSADGDISRLPLAEFTQAAAPAQSVEITAINLDAENRYVIDYQTVGFTEQLPGTHIHFFFDTFTADQVGMTGGGNRLMYGGPSPFVAFRAVSRPPQASQICALAANPDHSVIPNSGNCFKLPDVE